MRTFGTIKLEDGKWLITAEPHVLIRIKRLFDKINKREMGTVSITDNPENSKELEWFLLRYPMEMDANAKERLTLQSKTWDAHEKVISSILFDQNYKPPNFELALPARDYQKVAADLLLKRKSLLLADEVGIGKTVSAICTLTDPATLPCLFVTLTHLPTQMEEQIKKFAPELKVHILKKGKPYDLTKGGKPFPDVIICNYHKLSGWAETLAPMVNSLILDECQEVRRKDSLKYSAAYHLSRNTTYRLGLSATPIFNYGGEFHNVISILDPDVLGTRDEFLREWCSVGMDADKARIKDPKAFGTYLREKGVMLRRTREDVGRELPALTIIPHKIDADLNQIDNLAKNVAQLCETILSQQGFEKGVKLQAAGELDWKLRQATGLAKAPYVAQFVQLLVESDEKVLLYGWHHAVYEVWMDALKDLSPVLYTGEQSTSQKEKAKKDFIEGNSKVLIMSLRAGAGVDGLQGCARTVVFGELDWSPSTHHQNIGRLHRDGQQDKVIAYYLVSDVGSDPIISDVLGIKKQQLEGVIDPDAALIQKVERDPDHIKRLAEDFLKRHKRN